MSNDGILAELLGVDPKELRDGAPQHMLERGYVKGECSLPAHRAIVSEKARRVRCVACGVDLDPIAVLLDLAKHHDWYARLIADGNRIAKEVGVLEGQREKVRAELYRARKALKDAKALHALLQSGVKP